VNPEIQRTSKPVALSPAAAKVAVAAGVKPAALVTRLPPHDRAVPKPAFELTEKKLDPKAAAAGVKKAAVKAKPKKAAEKGKAIAGVKKTVPAGRSGTSTTAKNAVPAKPSLPVSHAARPASDGKPSSSPSLKPVTKPFGSGGQKPSPAVVKSQTSPGPRQ
jgi:hypothetical protein